MRSIGELGHIFDPAQAADDLSAPASSELPHNDKISRRWKDPKDRSAGIQKSHR